MRRRPRVLLRRMLPSDRCGVRRNPQGTWWPRAPSSAATTRAARALRPTRPCAPSSAQTREIRALWAAQRHVPFSQFGCNSMWPARDLGVVRNFSVLGQYGSYSSCTKNGKTATCRCAAHRAQSPRRGFALLGARGRVGHSARAAHLIGALLGARGHHVPCGLRRSVQRAADGASCAGACVPRRGVTCACWLPCGTCMAADIGPLIKIRVVPISRPYSPRLSRAVATVRNSPRDTLGEYGAPYALSHHRDRRIPLGCHGESCATRNKSRAQPP